MTKHTLTIIVLSCLLVGFSGTAAQAAELLNIELLPVVVISSTSYELSDLVASHNGREDFWQAISGETLGTLSSARPVLLERDAVLGLLAARGYDWRQISISGAARVQVSKAGNLVQPSEIVDYIKTETEAALNCSVDIIENLQHPLQSESFDDGRLEMRLRWPTDNSACLPDAVEFIIDGRQERVLKLNQYIEFSLDAVTADRDLPKSESIDASQLVVRTVSLKPGSRVVINPATVSGLQPSRLLRAGSIIELDDLLLPFAVERNESVRLLSSGAGLSSSAEGKAMQNGHIGETINVKRSLDGEMFSCVIMEKGVVEIR